jgi:hypothetical protein
MIWYNDVINAGSIISFIQSEWYYCQCKKKDYFSTLMLSRELSHDFLMMNNIVIIEAFPKVKNSQSIYCISPLAL